MSVGWLGGGDPIRASCRSSGNAGARTSIAKRVVEEIIEDVAGSPTFTTSCACRKGGEGREHGPPEPVAGILGKHSRRRHARPSPHRGKTVPPEHPSAARISWRTRSSAPTRRGPLVASSHRGPITGRQTAKPASAASIPSRYLPAPKRISRCPCRPSPGRTPPPPARRVPEGGRGGSVGLSDAETTGATRTSRRRALRAVDAQSTVVEGHRRPRRRLGEAPYGQG